MLDRPAHALAVDRIVHPRAALLALARVKVEIEFADEGALPIVDGEKAHRRMPHRRLRFADAHAVDRFDHAEEPGQHLVFGKILAHFLFVERVPPRLQALRHERDVPRRHLRKAKISAGERRQFGVIAFRERFRAPREVAQKCDDFVRDPAPSSAPARPRRNCGNRAAAPPRAAARECAPITGALFHSGLAPRSDPRVEYASCSRRRRSRFSAYCITGR